jgi:uncharacterized Zn-binding protein involved in type VI secretion
MGFKAMGKLLWPARPARPDGAWSKVCSAGRSISSPLPARGPLLRGLGLQSRTMSAISCPRLRALLVQRKSSIVGFGMRAVLIATVMQLFVTGLPPSASAQNPANTGPGVVTEGSGTVSIGGVSAARKGDAASGEGSVAQGSSNVFINGRPAATVGDRTDCGGVVLGSGGGVFINGKPAAHTGDLTSGCPGKSP